MKNAHRIVLIAATAASVSACGAVHRTGAPAPAAVALSGSHGAAAEVRTYRNAGWHIAIEVPADWAVHQDFTASYLANGAWKTYAGPHLDGTPILALVVPGSNPITDAELRIGASKRAPEVQGCTTPPAAVRPGSLGKATIAGVEFVTFEASDAAMSHYLDVRGYRVVHDGVCYAIDLLVYGSNPQVFDPPATPPFSRAQAFARLRAVLGSFRFTE